MTLSIVKRYPHNRCSDELHRARLKGMANQLGVVQPSMLNMEQCLPCPWKPVLLDQRQVMVMKEMKRQVGDMAYVRQWKSIFFIPVEFLWVLSYLWANDAFFLLVLYFQVVSCLLNLFLFHMFVLYLHHQSFDSYSKSIFLPSIPFPVPLFPFNS